MINQRQINHFFELFEAVYSGGIEPERFFRDEPYALEMLYLALSSDNRDLVTTAELVKRQRHDAARPRRAFESKEQLRERAEAALNAAQTDEARLATLGKPGAVPSGFSSTRRTQAINLIADEVLVLSKIASGFRRTFGTKLDVDEFARNDVYARTVLKLCTTSDNDELVALGSLFFDEAGKPTRHRRGQGLDPVTDFTQPLKARLGAP